MSLGSPDRHQIQPRDLLVGGGQLSELRSGSGSREVAGGQRMGGHHVCHVNSGTDQVVVDARTVGQPLVAACPELVEGGTTDQAQGRGQVGHAAGAASFTSDPQAGEQVGIDQDTLQLVDTDAPGQPGPGFQRIGQVLAAGAWIDPEPVAGDADVLRARAGARLKAVSNWAKVAPFSRVAR